MSLYYWSVVLKHIFETFKCWLQKKVVPGCHDRSQDAISSVISQHPSHKSPPGLPKPPQAPLSLPGGRRTVPGRVGRRASSAVTPGWPPRTDKLLARLIAGVRLGEIGKRWMCDVTTLDCYCSEAVVYPRGTDLWTDLL